MTNYLESCQSEFWKEVFEQEVNYVTRALKGCNDVLSVGCGPAIIERALQENNFNVTGLDVSEEALEGAPDSIRTVVGSAENMDKLLIAPILAVALYLIYRYVRKSARGGGGCHGDCGKCSPELMRKTHSFRTKQGTRFG